MKIQLFAYIIGLHTLFFSPANDQKRIRFVVPNLLFPMHALVYRLQGGESLQSHAFFGIHSWERFRSAWSGCRTSDGYSQAPWLPQGNGVPGSDLWPLQLCHLRFLLQRSGLPHAVAARRPRQGQRRSCSARLRVRLFLWTSGGGDHGPRGPGESASAGPGQWRALPRAPPLCLHHTAGGGPPRPLSWCAGPSPEGRPLLRPVLPALRACEAGPHGAGNTVGDLGRADGWGQRGRGDLGLCHAHGRGQGPAAAVWGGGPALPRGRPLHPGQRPGGGAPRVLQGPPAEQRPGVPRQRHHLPQL